MKCRTIIAIVCLIGSNGARGQNYSGYPQSSTPNFQVGATDADGRIVVNADWNTASTAQPDFFQGATGTSYNLTFGPDANLYNCGLVNGNAFDNFIDSPPASLPFVIQDATTGQATGSIPYNASAATVQAAIRSSLSTNWPQATVTQNGNTYQVTNGAPGAKPLLSVSINSPVVDKGVEVQGFVAETRTGTASQPEVQTLTIQSTHYLFTIDGTAALPSVVTNYGTLNILPPAPTNISTSEIAFIQNATFTNKGILGNFDCAVFSDTTAPWVLMHMGQNGHFVNDGVVSCCQGPYCGRMSVLSASVENSGVILTKWGASMQGAGLMNNYFTGGLVQESPDSYGIQLYGGNTAQSALASNWGYIAAETQGVYIAQPWSQFDDYGGPLEVGQMIYSSDHSSSLVQADLAYGGSIGSSYQSSGPGTNDTNSGGLGAAITSTGQVAGATCLINLHNRVDTIRSSTDGATPVGTLVNFMPILYGDIGGLIANNKNIVTLYFDDLAPDQVQTISSAITAGTRLFDSQATQNTVTAKFAVGGAQYSTQNIGQVVLKTDTNPSTPKRTTAALIGVYSGSLSNPQFYAATSLQNPATIALTGTGTPLQTGTLNIEMGWTLRLGKLTKAVVSGGPSDGSWVGTNDYTASLASCTGIEIDNGTATSENYVLDGMRQGSQTHELPGNLVVDNFSTPLVLPPLIGSGNFVQQGASTTTVDTNRFKGALYIPHGTLKMAQGTSLSQIKAVYMQSKDVTRFASTLDVSQAAATAPFAGSSFSAGIVLPTLMGTLPVSCFNTWDANYLFPPIINIGSNNLVVGNGTGPASSLFQGQIQGTGGLEVAPGTTLILGGTVASGNTYSGNTYVDAGATLLLSTFPLNTTGQSLRMCGSGNLVNFGTIQTTSGNPQVGVSANSKTTPQDAAGAGANHVIYVNGNYTQGTGGNLSLKVNSALLASGGTPAAPGAASDYLKAGGSLTLGTEAYLSLDDVHPAALTQPATVVIAQAGSGTLGGANIFTSGTTGAPLYEGTILQVGLNSAAIHYGTLPNHAGDITLTFFPTGFGSWTSTDVGAVGAAGSASYGNGAYTVSGSGADIWSTVDAFQFVEQPLVGDGAISARVTSVQNTSGWAKAGVMIRDSLAPGAPYFAAFMTPGYGLTIQWRTASGGGSFNNVTSGVTTPNWVKVARVGNTFSAYQSKDGVNWAQIKDANAKPLTITVNMNSAASAGLAVTSHNNAALCTAAFDNVNILPGTKWSAADIGAPGLAGFTSYSDGLLSVEASGGVWTAPDQFRYVYQPVSGDCDISARIVDVVDTNPKAKAGLMIRGTLASDSAHYFLLATPEQGVFLQDRTAAGGGSAYLKQTPTLGAPLWLRLKRSGSTLTTYTSADGVNWTVFTTVTNLTLSANAYVGIAVTGSNATTLGAAEFDSILVTP